MIATAELIARTGIKRATLYYLEQKGFVRAVRKRVGKRDFHFYTHQEARKIELIWRHLKRGCGYDEALERTLRELVESDS